MCVAAGAAGTAGAVGTAGAARRDSSRASRGEAGGGPAERFAVRLPSGFSSSASAGCHRGVGAADGTFEPVSSTAGSLAATRPLLSCRVLRDGVFGTDAAVGAASPPGGRTVFGAAAAGADRSPAGRRLERGELRGEARCISDTMRWGRCVGTDWCTSPNSWSPRCPSFIEQKLPRGPTEPQARSRFEAMVEFASVASSEHGLPPSPCRGWAR